ncbi:MAG TPA: sorbosone dehydrogenase family protein [Caulobacteraceae bacterium]|nr:sorbosone dehydrogenase family protein [Caulobacteraceae bacterium]
MRFVPAAALVMSLAACSGGAPPLNPAAGYGADPALPAPRAQTIPTVKIADPVGWPAGRTPTPAPGLAVNAFAAGLEHPRWIYVLPNGDVLVAETAAPPKKPKGLRGWAAKLLMSKAGAGEPSADRITLLRDADGDGAAETRSVLVDGLVSPFGMALVGDRLFVANTDALVSLPYVRGATRIDAEPVVLAPLPGGPINHHWTKSLLASPDGSKLYVGVGSNSNVGENGLAAEENRAAILEVDAVGGRTRVFASGLRNPVGLAWNPETGALWTAVNERDEIGDDLVPDYMTSVKDGGFYGWPWSWWGGTVDARVKPPRPDRVARAIRPDYGLGAHTASLGLTFYTADLVPAWRNGALIGQHGSWNRSKPSGYKVIYVPFTSGRPSGAPQDVLTGFLSPGGEAWGRPVGVAVDVKGALLVADDVGDVIWRVAPSR